MTIPIPLHTELRMRQSGEAVWDATYAQDLSITSKKAFIEGHYLAMASGVQACRQTRMECELRIRQLEAERAAVFAVGLLSLAAAVIGVLSR